MASTMSFMIKQWYGLTVVFVLAGFCFSKLACRYFVVWRIGHQYQERYHYITEPIV
jgi:hypothetical protein